MAVFLTLPCQAWADSPPTTGANEPDQSLAGRTLAAIDSGNLLTLRKSLDQQAALALSDPPRIDLPAATELSAFRQFARYFGAISPMTDSQRQTLKWLVAQPHLMPVLMSAISILDSPSDLLALLQTLKDDQGPQLDADADLVTAFLVVWDKDLPSADPDEPTPLRQRAIQLLRYFQTSRTLQVNPRLLPWQLLVYVVDVKLSEAEMLWATQHYGRRAQLGSTYFDVPYDANVYSGGSQKQVTRHGFTLPNLLQYGGVCIDQAYFATQIAKTMGVPSCICTGEGGDAGIGNHAWAGYLAFGGLRPQWDFTQGRYDVYLFWSSNIVDPQTHQRLNDADVGLLAELLNSAPPQRLQSALLLKLTDAAPSSARAALYEQAISLSPGNRAAWLALARLGQQKALAPDQRDEVDQAIHRYLLTRYPDFAWELLVQIASGQAIDPQLQTVGQLVALFHDRPDLAARLRVRQGDLLRQSSRDDDALAAYEDVLLNYLKSGPPVLNAMNGVDQILRGRNDSLRLARIYQQVWKQLPRPEPSAYAYESPFYRVGSA